MPQLDTKALSAEVAGVWNRALTPMLERLAAIEARLGPLGDVRDRLVAVETKYDGLAVGPDTSVESRLVSALDRLSTLEYALKRTEGYDATLTDLQARLAAAEAVAAHYTDLASTARQLTERVAVVEAKAAATVVTEVTPERVERSVLDLSKDVAAVRERIAVMESKSAAPGPPGPAGKDGRDGLDGKDGADGFGLNDLHVVQGDDERSLIVRGERDGRVKDLGSLTLPVDIYRGVWLEHKTYERGDGVTWAGCEWHCNEATASKPGQGSKAWTLKVKCGRDGRDGKDAPGALPVVTVGPGRG